MHALGFIYEVMCNVERIALEKNLKGAVNVGIQRGLDLNPTLFIDWYCEPNIRFCRAVVGINLKFIVSNKMPDGLMNEITRKFELAIKLGA